MGDAVGSYNIKNGTAIGLEREGGGGGGGGRREGDRWKDAVPQRDIERTRARGRGRETETDSS